MLGRRHTWQSFGALDSRRLAQTTRRSRTDHGTRHCPDPGNLPFVPFSVRWLGR